MKFMALALVVPVALGLLWTAADHALGVEIGPQEIPAFITGTANGLLIWAGWHFWVRRFN